MRKTCSATLKLQLIALVALATIFTSRAFATSAEPSAEWAFQPIQHPLPPQAKDSSWATSPIDQFVLAKMTEHGLSPAAPASKREWLRRVTYDLTGLPPTPREVSDFLNDSSPQAFDKVADRLLNSPRYGERWGKHWLDVVRFGESNGYEQNHLRPNAWPYRDYVIRAFNDDKPYDRFITEQLAGDVVGKDDPKIEPATGYLVAGIHDTVGIATEEGSRQQRANDLDDIITTTGATFLGLTVGCAHCHDHKFDPIPQRDYYRLKAVFAGVKHGERAMPATRSLEGQRKIDGLVAQIKQAGDEYAAIDRLAQDAAIAAEKGAAEQRGMLREAVNPQHNIEDFAAVSAKFARFVIDSTIDGSEPCIDELEIYAAANGENLALAAHGGKASASSLLPGFAIHQISHLNDGQYGNSASWISNERGKGWAQIELPAPATISRVIWGRDNSPQRQYADRVPLKYRVMVSLDGQNWQTVATGDDRRTPNASAVADASKYLTAEQKARKAALSAEIDKLKVQKAALDPPKMYAGTFDNPDDIHILKRGDVMQPLEAVTAGAISRIPGISPDFTIDQSVQASDEARRRLGLANWICQKDNPLTARVMVNRIWQHHFGRGIVATPSDFGVNGAKPSNAELLDWLASDFVEHGWRIKRLQRMIVLSNVYRQSSAASAQAVARDADDVFLSHMPLVRLESEAVRDSILADSGNLDLRMGGPGFQLFKYRVINVAIYEPLEDQGPSTWRRSVYQICARAIHDELLGCFDEPECSMREPRRSSTTTPLQALTLLNSKFVNEQAAFFAKRVEREADADARAQVDRAFEIAFGRKPADAERAAAVSLVKKHGLALLCRGIFNSNEFVNY